MDGLDRIWPRSSDGDGQSMARRKRHCGQSSDSEDDGSPAGVRTACSGHRWLLDLRESNGDSEIEGGWRVGRWCKGGEGYILGTNV